MQISNDGRGVFHYSFNGRKTKDVKEELSYKLSRLKGCIIIILIATAVEDIVTKGRGVKNDLGTIGAIGEMISNLS